MLWLRSMWCSLAQVANEQFDNELYQRLVGFPDRVVVVHMTIGSMSIHMTIGIMLAHVTHIVAHLVIMAHIVAHVMTHLGVVVVVAVYTLLIKLVVAVVFFSLVLFCRGILAVIVVHRRSSHFHGG